MSNVRYTLIVVFACLCGLFGYWVSQTSKQGAVVKTLTKQVETARAVTAINDSVALTRERAKVASNKQKEVTDARTEIALQAHPEWAGQPVPDDVVDALADGVRD